MKIYTKTGDNGTTSLFSGKRVSKHHIRVEAYGTVDELNAHLGLLRDLITEDDHKKKLHNIQNELFVMGSILATENPKKAAKNLTLHPQQVESLENAIDHMNESLPTMTHFIIPGGHPIISQCHIARTVCRRAERMITFLNEQEPLPPLLLVYLNRLSDFLFVLARKLGQELKVEEIKWVPS